MVLPTIHKQNNFLKNIKTLILKLLKRSPLLIVFQFHTQFMSESQMTMEELHYILADLLKETTAQFTQKEPNTLRFLLMK